MNRATLPIRSFLIVAGLFTSVGLIIAAAPQATSTPTPAPARASAPAAQPAAAHQDNLRSLLEVFRSDFNTAKIRTINQAMQMTSAEAEKFWPIYRRYEAELAALGDRRISLIREFVKVQAGSGMTDKTAADLADRWLAAQQDRLDLWKKYHGEISKGVSPLRAAQFLQIEHQISLLVDINIASEMPMVDSKPAVDQNK